MSIVSYCRDRINATEKLAGSRGLGKPGVLLVGALCRELRLHSFERQKTLTRPEFKFFFINVYC